MKTTLLSLTLIPMLTGCGLMQSMMTRSVDPTANAKIVSLHGPHGATRMDDDGNSRQLQIAIGHPLKTADLVIGSESQTNRLVLALDAHNRARFESADFVLRSPLGEDSDEFSATVEIGSALFTISQGANKSFEIRDTNKNRVFLENTNAQFYVAVGDDDIRVFVRSGTVKVENERTELEYVLTANQGVTINAQGVGTPVQQSAEWVQPIDWEPINITKQGAGK